jgi:hypothetical protein
MGPTEGPTPRQTGRLTVGRNITWTWTCVIALQITDPSSRQRGRPAWRRRKLIVTQRNVKSVHLLQKEHYTEMNWPINCRSQYNLNLNPTSMHYATGVRTWPVARLSVYWRSFMHNIQYVIEQFDFHIHIFSVHFSVHPVASAEI